MITPNRPKGTPSDGGPPLVPPLVVRRILRAPVSLVYRAWTDPKFLVRWNWGREYTTLSVSIDLRVGGRWTQQIGNTANGEVWTFDGEFREIVPNKRLVHTFHWVKTDGLDHGVSLVAIDFLDRNADECEVVITHTEIATEEHRSGTDTGWREILDHIAEIVAEGSL